MVKCLYNTQFRQTVDAMNKARATAPVAETKKSKAPEKKEKSAKVRIEKVRKQLAVLQEKLEKEVSASAKEAEGAIAAGQATIAASFSKEDYMNVIVELKSGATPEQALILAVCGAAFEKKLEECGLPPFSPMEYKGKLEELLDIAAPVLSEVTVQESTVDVSEEIHALEAITSAEQTQLVTEATAPIESSVIAKEVNGELNVDVVIEHTLTGGTPVTALGSALITALAGKGRTQ